VSDDETIRAGYELIAPAYHAGRASRDAVNVAWLDGLRPRMPASGKVVDLGCGSGVPITRYFATRGYEVEGYDVSPAMLAIARREVPSARFAEGRLEELAFDADSIDVVLSFFAIIHVPRERHAALFARFRGWLRPGGVALLTLGADDQPHRAEPWHGVPMSWSHFDADTNLGLLRDAGLELDWHDVETFGPSEAHLFVLARRPAD
jgi:SAM-dependent methyltransferase